MTFDDAKIKIINCQEQGNTLCIILLIIRFGIELLHFLNNHNKQKNEKNNTEN